MEEARGGYRIVCITPSDERLQAIFSRIHAAEEEISKAYSELRNIFTVDYKCPPAVTDRHKDSD